MLLGLQSSEMDSREYRALNQCYPRLVSCLKQSPNDLLDQMIPFGILAEADRCFVNNPQHNNDEKARKIVDAVHSQVKGDTGVFQSFIEAMKAAGPWTRTTVNMLEQSLSSQPPATTTQKYEGLSRQYIIVLYVAHNPQCVMHMQTKRDKAFFDDTLT